MVGVLLISHGEMAKGMLDSISLFIPDAPQLDALELKAEDNPEDFRTVIEEKIKELDTGEGVIIFADMLGGTPANQTAYLLSDKVQVVTGMNLGMVLECLTLRQFDDVSIEHLISVGREGVVHLNELFRKEE